MKKHLYIYYNSENAYYLKQEIMKKAKKFIIDLYNRLFEKPKEETSSRRLEQNPKTGKLNWTNGDKPFMEESSGIEIEAFHLDDSNNIRTAHLKIPSFTAMEPFFKNRFYIEFPGIPGHYFNSYNYLGHDIHTQRLLTSSKGVIKDDYSVFKVLLTIGGEIDICDKLIELESNPKIGDIKIHMLDPTGLVIKTILVPDCEVTEIKAFRDLSYGVSKEKSNDVLYGEIVVKHRQRKLI